MTNAMMCEHGINRITCLKCWRTAQQKPAPAPRDVSQVPSAVNVPVPQHGAPSAPPPKVVPPEAHSNEALWQPPARPQLINTLPRRSKT
jgi:hypothetical protein